MQKDPVLNYAGFPNHKNLSSGQLWETHLLLFWEAAPPPDVPYFPQETAGVFAAGPGTTSISTTQSLLGVQNLRLHLRPPS